MNRAEPVSQLLEKRIVAEAGRASQVRTVGVVLMFCSILPLAFLVPCLIWIIPAQASPWITAGVAAACLATCVAVWNIGGHFTKLSASRIQRSRQLEDLQLYLMSIPEEKWPARNC